MSEESILILNMLRDGTITAEQADALLRAVRQPGAPSQAGEPSRPSVPLAPTPPPVPPTPGLDGATLSAMQNKLGDLQSKLGDLQGKLGAAQVGQALSFADMILDHLPKSEMDFSKIGKTVDEAIRGLGSLKNDTLRGAKKAARSAATEAKRAARQSGRAIKFDLNVTFGDDSESEKPGNEDGQPQASETSDTAVTWAGASTLALSNTYGSIKVIGDETVAGDSVLASVTKTAWGMTDAEARVLLQQIFLTSRVENGRCRIEIVAPADAADRMTADYEIRVPQTLGLELETTFGDIEAEAASSALAVDTIAGKTTVRRPFPTAAETRLKSRSGSVRLEDFNVPDCRVTAHTISGDISANRLACRQTALSTRTGDMSIKRIQTGTDATFESVSGDVTLKGGAVGTRLGAKTQSGDINIEDLRTEQLGADTVSGDICLQGVAGQLTVKTISGEVEADRIQSPAAALGTVSGDANWTFAAPFSGSFAGTTVSGDLSVALWTNSDTRVEMTTTSGDLRCDLPLDPSSPESTRHLNGKIGDGIGSLKLQSVSGDLRIKKEQ